MWGNRLVSNVALRLRVLKEGQCAPNAHTRRPFGVQAASKTGPPRASRVQRESAALPITYIRSLSTIVLSCLPPSSLRRRRWLALRFKRETSASDERSSGGAMLFSIVVAEPEPRAQRARQRIERHARHARHARERCEPWERLNVKDRTVSPRELIRYSIFLYIRIVYQSTAVDAYGASAAPPQRSTRYSCRLRYIDSL